MIHQYLNPSLILNSSGFRNHYGHPSTSVVKTIEELHKSFYDTQEYGAIRLTLIGKLILIESSRKGIIGIMY